MPFMAGAARLPYLRFLTFNAIGCILWATLYSLVGFIFGQSWHLVDKWIGRAGIIGMIFSTMVVVTIVLWRGIASRELEIREWWRQLFARPGWISVPPAVCAPDRLAGAALLAARLPRDSPHDRDFPAPGGERDLWRIIRKGWHPGLVCGGGCPGRGHGSHITRTGG